MTEGYEPRLSAEEAKGGMKSNEAIKGEGEGGRRNKAEERRGERGGCGEKAAGLFEGGA